MSPLMMGRRTTPYIFSIPTLAPMNRSKVLLLSLRASAALSVTAPPYSAHTLLGRVSEAAEKFNAAFPELSLDPATDAVMRRKQGFGESLVSDSFSSSSRCAVMRQTCRLRS